MGEPKYRRALDTLKSEILGGKYKTRKSFPSLAATCARFKISRLTAVKAFEKLKEEGLIRSRIGAGTFVTRRAQSRLIGLVVPGLSYSSDYFQKIISAMVAEAQRSDYSILVDGAWGPDSKCNSHEAIEVAARLIRRKVAGVIYHPVEHSENSDEVNDRILTAFSRAKIPVVLLDSDIVPWPGRSSYDLVSVDNVGAGSTLARHLIGNGAKNILFLMRNNLIGNLADRVKGVEMAVLAAGGKWNRAHVLLTDPSDAGSIARIMRRRPRPDALICENAGFVARLRQTLAGLGYDVPSDVMVAGFDDAGAVRAFVPSMTTVNWAADAMAEMAFVRLWWRIARPELPPMTFLVPYALRTGSSTTMSQKNVKPRKVRNKVK